MAYTIDVHLSPEEVRNQMRSDAVAGLQSKEKSIPPVWFYDERGSRLFEVITQLPALLKRHFSLPVTAWMAYTLESRHPVYTTPSTTVGED